MEEGTIQATNFKQRVTVFSYEFIGIAIMTMIWTFANADPFVNGVTFFILY